MRRGLARLLLLLGIGLCAVAAAEEAPAEETAAEEAAAAETIRLRSGRALEVSSVRVLADRLNVSVEADGVLSRVDLPFVRIDPESLLRVLDTRSDVTDAHAWLRSARLALAGGLHDHAAVRFVEAARLDPTLRTARNEGLADIRRAEAQAGLRDLEQRLRDGRDPRGATLLAEAILDSAYTAELTVAQRGHVEALGRLARRLVQRDVARFQAQQQKAALQAQKDAAFKHSAPSPAGAASGPSDAMPPVPDDTPADELAPLRAQLAKALHARGVAADPAVSVEDAMRHLEIAARELLDARRAAHRVRVEDLDEESATELEDLGLELRELLIGSYLELANLYRQRQLFEEARARVRAVLILDPGNEQAWSQRHLIEDDLREALQPIEDPYRYTIRSAAFIGWYSPSPYYGYCLAPRAVPYARGGTFLGYRGFGYRGGGVPRAVPYRRATGRRR